MKATIEHKQVDVDKASSEYDDFVDATDTSTDKVAEAQEKVASSDVFKKQLGDLKDEIFDGLNLTTTSAADIKQTAEEKIKDKFEKSKDSDTSFVTKVIDTNDKGETQEYLQIKDGDKSLLIETSEASDADALLDTFIVDQKESEIQKELDQKILEHNTQQQSLEATEQQLLDADQMNIDLDIDTKTKDIADISTPPSVSGAKVGFMGAMEALFTKLDPKPLYNLIKTRAGLGYGVAAMMAAKGKDKVTKLAIEMDFKKQKDNFMASVNDVFEPITEMVESVTEVAEDVKDINDKVL